MTDSGGKTGHPRARTVTVAEDFAGQRVDNFLARELRGVPRSRIYRILRRGEVRVNRGRVRPGHRLEAGDLVRIPPLRLATPGNDALPPALSRRLTDAVIYEDQRLLVMDKPAGVAVHGGSGLSHGVIEALRKLRTDCHSLELVHRLDRETSGCLMIAKKRSELRALHELLRNGAMEKRYLALLARRLPEDLVVVDTPLRVVRRNGERFAEVAADGRPAHTEFRRLQNFRHATLVEVLLGTGRTHQIRAHAASIGNPVAGDERYGDAGANKRFAQGGLRRLFLHAHALRFERPHNGEDFQVSAPLPDDLREVLDSLKL
ncbi:MAG: RluA family pseudouridine synthase [Gammaproteobacteria bacterium]|nr:RluA family pseudouridine synthase [Gammaproteobacteria bacterium]NNF59768.1 RluA family pseudouridine synthase [Gammaproteobacteria bacterium]NNM20962.1 RluA family pseudouridine synthase [Gammaproteobacteria bacterium]